MKPPPNFNMLARSYRWMERLTFGPWLWRCRCAFLEDLRSCRSALVIGDGDGRFTAQLLRENSAVVVDAMDVSKNMLAELARNAGIFIGRVRIHLADARSSEFPPLPYDLIVTHFFLDCLTTAEIGALAAQIRRQVRPESRWVVSEFAVPPGLVGWLIARPLITVLYLAFWILTGLSVHRLPNYHKALAESDFILANEKTWLGGILVSELWTPKPAKPAREIDFEPWTNW
ncbi:MAG TPA: class I SAM-dependent methyltransferase [Terracidiphilus sp.]|nr:class I SAM-dependent methyltransferase [Terracidiphilus sp.]